MSNLIYKTYKIKSFLTLFLLSFLVMPISLQAECEFSWEPQESGTTENLSKVFFLDSETGWAVGSNGTIVHTTDAGETWSTQNTPVSGVLTDIYFTDENNGWATGISSVLHTTDGGETWLDRSGDINGNAYESVHFVNANNGWIAGPFGLANTTDGGGSWMVNDTFTSLIAVHFTDENNGWAAGGEFDIDEGAFVSKVIGTTDGGETWTLEYSKSGGRLYTIEFFEKDHGWIGSGEGLNLLVTTDGGENWTEVSSSSRWSDISFLDTETGLSARDGDIYFSENGGNSWSKQDKGTAEGIGSIHFTDLRYRWAVGVNGTILRYHIPFDEPAEVVEQRAPANNADNVSNFPGYLWFSTDRACNYHIQVSESPDFDELFVDRDDLTNVQYDGNLAYEFETTYYWRVRGLNPIGTGDWSETWSFTTRADDDNDGPNALVNADNHTMDITLYPNPAINQTNLDIRLEHTENLNIYLTDLAGRKVLSIAEDNRLSAGEHQFNVDLNELTKGIYLLNISGNNSHQVLNLIVK